MKGVRFRSVILPVAFPIFLGMLVFQIQTVANRAFLGQVDTAWLAVVSNVVFPLWTMMAMLNSLSTGATILISHALGAGDKARAKTLGALALVGNSAIAAVCYLFWATSSRGVYELMGVQGKILEDCVAYTSVAALSFLGTGLSGALTSIFQATTKTKPLMVSGVVRSLVNIALDVVLIFGFLGFPQMGLLGAATATVVADAFGLVVLAALLLWNKDLEARPDRATWRSLKPMRYLEIVKMGLPTSLEDLLWNVGNLVLIGYMNALDPLATAVYSIIFTIEIVAIIVFMSLGQATVALVGRAKGAGEPERVRSLVLTSQLAAWTASGAVALLFLVAPFALVGLFTNDASLVARTAPILLVSCLMLFPRSVNFMAGSGIRGLGDTKWMLGTQVFGTLFLVSLGYLFIFVLNGGVAGLFWAMCVDELVRAIINGFHLNRLAARVSVALPEPEAESA